MGGRDFVQLGFVFFLVKCGGVQIELREKSQDDLRVKLRRVSKGPIFDIRG